MKTSSIHSAISNLQSLALHLAFTRFAPPVITATRSPRTGRFDKESTHVRASASDRGDGVPFGGGRGSGTAPAIRPRPGASPRRPAARAMAQPGARELGDGHGAGAE